MAMEFRRRGSPDSWELLQRLFDEGQVGPRSGGGGGDLAQVPLNA